MRAKKNTSASQIQPTIWQGAVFTSGLLFRGKVQGRETGRGFWLVGWYPVLKGWKIRYWKFSLCFFMTPAGWATSKQRETATVRHSGSSSILPPRIQQIRS